jgi:CubicO group peptidase (beta-lactamase class C family)
MKFGLLYSNGGRWNGKQIIPQSWVRESCQAHVNRPNGGAYGYQFWLWQDTINHKLTSLIACVGNGDQRIFIDKTNDLLVVVTAGNYNKWNIKNNAGALVKNYVYASLKK